MAKVNKSHILEKIRKEGYTIKVLDGNENVKSKEYVPPLTEEERILRDARRAIAKEISKIRQLNGVSQIYTQEELISLLESSGLIGKADNLKYYVYV
jgi:hypothetical protein